MANELEKQFFDTFGIEQRQRKACVDKNVLCPTPKVDCDDCFYFQYVPEYPYIGNRALLGMICILAKQGIYLEDMNGLFKMKTYETSMVMQNADNLKDVILKTVETAFRLSKDDNFKHQVRTLFEEG